MKRIISFIVLLLCYGFFTNEHALAEKYSGINGPQVNCWAGARVDMGASNIIHFNSPNVNWYVNSNGAGDNLTYAQTHAAIANACEEWESVTTSTLTFSDEESTSNTWGNDGFNVHSWAESGDPIYDEGNPFESANVAVTFCTINGAEQILDTDVVYNGRDYTWRVNGSNMDIQAAATHEIGHMFGLHHTESTSTPRPTMYGQYIGTEARYIEFDDSTGVSFLYGGNLIDNETFSGTKYFYWNLTVCPNKTLTIAANAAINLNSKKITTSTGTITVQSGASIPPNVMRKNSSNVLKGLYPSIPSALNDATSGDQIYKGSGSQTLTSQITVPSGISLTFQSGSTTYMNNCSITTINGSIFLISGATFVPKIKRINSSEVVKGLYPTIASAMSAIKALDEIHIGTGTFYESVTIPKDSCSLIGDNENTTIINGTVSINNKKKCVLSTITANNDVTVDGGSAIKIENVRAKDIIDIENGTGHILNDIELINNGYIDIYQTGPNVEDIISTTSVNYGIICGDADYRINNGTFENKTRALYCVSNSDVLLDNPLLCNNSCDIYSANGSSVTVLGLGSMSSCPPPVIGNVTFEVDCESNCGDGSSSSESLTKENILPLEGIDDSPEGQEFAELRNLYRAIQAEIRADRKDSIRYDISKYAPRYTQVIAGMKVFVTKYPDSDYAKQAIKIIDFCYRALDQRDAFGEYLTALGKDAKYKSLQTTIKSQFIPYYLGKGEYETALNLTDEVMKEQTDPENELYYLYRKGVIYHKYLKDAAKAEEIYKQVIDTDPNSAMAFSAGVRLGKLGKVYEGENKPAAAEPEVKFAIRNHPNPFNPVTNIQFDLPEADHVTLKVYDITGREVVTLVDALQGAGSHTIVWNSQDKFGQRVASGMYFYRIEYRGQVLTNKMILMR